jgi:multidrug efflux pump subunit AcrA (membrane-fusion protein)
MTMPQQPHLHPNPESPDHPPAPSQNGSRHPQPTRSPSSASPTSGSDGRSLPGDRPRKRFLHPAVIALLVIVVLVGLGTGVLFAVGGMSLFQAKRGEYLTYTVKPILLPVSVVERGTLESADNREVICKVKAGSRGTFATSIRWVIDDGSYVQKGQRIMDLDDSALRDQEQNQSIVVEKARSEFLRAEEELNILSNQTESDLAAAVAALKVAQLDVEKFLGVRAEPRLDPFGALATAHATLTERGEFRMKLDDVSGRLKLAESDMEAFRDRASWAERSVRQGFLTPSQAKVELSKLAAQADNLEKLQKEKFALEAFTRIRDLTDLLSKVEIARLGLERAKQQGHAKKIQGESDKDTKKSVLLQEEDKLKEIRDQIRECKLVAPQTGMVVYYKEAGSRWGSSTQGMIAVGEQVREGQKLLRIPDLNRMQVNTKIHEALVSRIRGDERVPTGNFESARLAMLLIPHAMTRLTSQFDVNIDHLRELLRNQEYSEARPGQRATIRVDAFPDREFKGRVRTVAAVASMSDFMSSDVKLYQTMVLIEDTNVTGLRPDMSAEVVIHVEQSEKEVLAVPVQSVYGGSEFGAKRKLFVLENGVPKEREVVLGSFNEKLVEVREGLESGDVVITNPKVILGDKAKTREEGDLNRAKGGGGKGGDSKGKSKPNSSGAPPDAVPPKKS